MNYKVKYGSKEFLFDTIEEARECRERLINMGYHEISIIVQRDDTNI